MIPEYVIHARLKNNLLLSRILNRHNTVAEFCAEHDLSQSAVGYLVNLKKPATLAKHGWNKLALQLAEIFGCEPEDLFSEEQATAALRTNAAYIEMTRQQALLAFGSATDPVLALEDKNVVDAVKTALFTIPEREREVLEARMQDMTYDEIAKRYGVTRERIRQIEAMALRKMRHPSRCEPLRQFVDGLELGREGSDPDEDEWTIARGEKKTT